MPVDDRTKKKTDYALYRAVKENPRVTIKELFDVVKSVRNKKRKHKSWTSIIDESFKDQILVGPRLYCNSGIEVTLFDEGEPEKEESDFGISLAGQYSYILFSPKKEGNLEYVELVNPKFPKKVTLESRITCDEKEFFDQCFAAPGMLTPDKNPQWDDTDWKVYWGLQNPRQNFFTVGKELGIPWDKVKERYEKILKDCKVLMGFFPLGYSRYDHLLVTVTTEYETGLQKWLHGLDRSSWLLKVGNTLIMYLFHTHINLTCLKLVEMEEMGILNDFRWAFPILEREEPFFLLF